jgi:hypothetical protein
MQEILPAPADFLVRDQNDHRYVAELAVPWSADDRFWQDYADTAPSAQRSGGPADPVFI